MSIAIANPMMRKVTQMTGITAAQIQSSSRLKDICRARHVLMLVLRERTAWPYTQIAHFLGRSDHSTVISGERKVRRLYGVCEETTALVDALRAIEPGDPFGHDEQTIAAVKRAVAKLPPYTGPIRPRYYDHHHVEGRDIWLDRNGNTEYETLALNSVKHGSQALLEALNAARAA